MIGRSLSPPSQRSTDLDLPRLHPRVRTPSPRTPARVSNQHVRRGRVRASTTASNGNRNPGIAPTRLLMCFNRSSIFGTDDACVVANDAIAREQSRQHSLESIVVRERERRERALDRIALLSRRHGGRVAVTIEVVVPPLHHAAACGCAVAACGARRRARCVPERPTACAPKSLPTIARPPSSCTSRSGTLRGKTRPRRPRRQPRGGARAGRRRGAAGWGASEEGPAAEAPRAELAGRPPSPSCRPRRDAPGPPRRAAAGKRGRRRRRVPPALGNGGEGHGGGGGGGAACATVMRGGAADERPTTRGGTTRSTLGDSCCQTPTDDEEGSVSGGTCSSATARAR